MRSSSVSAAAEGADPGADAAIAGIEAAVGTALGPYARVLPPGRAMALLGLRALEPAYRRARALSGSAPEPRTLDGRPGFDAALLDALEIDWRITAGSPGAIPATGPLMVVGNHPTGGVEGLIMAAVVDARRSDRLALGNAAVGLLPEIGRHQIGIDNRTKRGNLPALRRAATHLAAGGVVTTFPAGTVAHLRWSRGRVQDAPWHRGIARLALGAGACVLPVHFEAQAGALWHCLAPFSRTARSLLLARALLHQRGRRIDLRIGTPLYDRDRIASLFARYD